MNSVQTLADAIRRLQEMHTNLIGAGGVRQREDRRALLMAVTALNALPEQQKAQPYEPPR